MQQYPIPEANDNNSTPHDSLQVDYDQDIIQVQDIESGKDITDQTDAEKEKDKEKEKEIAKDKQTNIFEMKKKYIKEGENIDNDDDNNIPCERTVVEKSPKGRFHRFNEELGSGAHKRVYRAYDYDVGREVAWNAISVNLMTEEAICKIKEEIVMMKKLNHPNIISFISGFYNEEKKEVVIITEMFSGGSLKQHLCKYGNPRLRVIKFWCKEILKGLQYLHELDNQVIHRDIKCDNIFINKTTSEVKIGDLGFSCTLKGNDYARTLSGTMEFCAPEVFFGKYGVKADIYSFGICMLEMITNERPYKECEGNLLNVCERATNQVLPNCLEKVRNPRLVEFIKSCLKKENERPSARALLDSAFLNDIDSEENNYPGLMYPHIEVNVAPSNNIAPIANESSLVTTNASSKAIAHVYPSKKIKDLVGDKSNKSCNLQQLPNGKCNGQPEKVSSGVLSFSSSKILLQSSNDVPSKITPKNARGFARTSSNANTTEHLNTNNNNNNNTNNNNNNLLIYKDDDSHDKTEMDDQPVIQLYKGTIINKNNKGLYYSSTSSDFEDLPLNSTSVNDTSQNEQKGITNNNIHTSKINSGTLVDTFEPKSNKEKPASKNKNRTIFSSPPKPNVSQHYSKIDIQIEEEQKHGDIIKILLIKKDKSRQKVYKIKFTFNLKKDTCEGVVKELETEINLTEGEKMIIKQKLSNLVKNYTNTIIGLENASSDIPALSEAQDVKQFLEAKACLTKFIKKYKSILEEAEEIIQTSKSLKDSSYDEEKEVFMKKITALEELIKYK